MCLRVERIFFLHINYVCVSEFRRRALHLLAYSARYVCCFIGITISANWSHMFFFLLQFQIFQNFLFYTITILLVKFNWYCLLDWSFLAFGEFKYQNYNWQFITMCLYPSLFHMCVQHVSFNLNSVVHWATQYEYTHVSFTFRWIQSNWTCIWRQTHHCIFHFVIYFSWTKIINNKKIPHVCTFSSMILFVCVQISFFFLLLFS